MQAPVAPALGVGPRRNHHTLAQVLPEADEEGRVGAYHFVVKRSYDVVAGKLAERRASATAMHAADVYFDGGGLLDASLRHPTDLLPPKPGCDVVVVGHCHPPGGEATDCTVELHVEDRKKAVRVIGDRTAVLRRGERWATLRGPRPFSVMPLRWELAYGGPAFAANPIGCGCWPDDALPPPPPEFEGELPEVPGAPSPLYGPLPNLVPESAWPGPEDLAFDRAATSAPSPANLGWLSRHWARRPAEPVALRSTPAPRAAPSGRAAPANVELVGDRLVARQFAPDDQVFPHPHGGEPITLVNLHPSVPRLRFQLPMDRPTVHWNHGAGRERVAMNLDTVTIEPDLDRLDLVWRGTLEVPADARTAAVCPRLVDVDGELLPWVVRLTDPLDRAALLS